MKTTLALADMGLKWYERLLDLLLVPVMFLLNRGAFPLQETHHWHTINMPGHLFPKQLGLLVKGTDKQARFGHSAPLGLYHMPILGGLTKYVVLEVKDFDSYWHIVFKPDQKAQIHRLKLVDSRLKLLVGKEDNTFFAIDNAGKLLPLKAIGFGKIGDKRYNGVRLL